MSVPAISAHFEILPHSGPQGWTAKIIINNHSDYKLSNWRFHFCAVRLIEQSQLTNAVQELQSGDYYILKPLSPLAAGESLTIQLGGLTGGINYLSDLPLGLFITDHYYDGKQADSINLSLTHNLAPALGAQYQDIPRDIEPAEIAVFPQPQHIRVQPGFFILDANTQFKIHSNNQQIHHAVSLFCQQLKLVSNINLSVDPTRSSAKQISLFEDPSQDNTGGYRLDISSTGVEIRANHPSGFSYALATMQQLLPAAYFACQLQSGICWQLPLVNIQDQPRFAYRGFLLDVCRHFYDVNEIKRLLDILAAYKINQFHWHLTDDEGWRIEIKAFPRLIEIGAFRGLNHTLSPQFGSGASSYGGYYTQEQIKEVVAYAAKRAINIIPEIDVPGHARVMVKAYPELLLDTEDTSTYCTEQNYHDNLLSPALESTYSFVFKVLEEVVALFPSPYIHLGGDEVPQGAWEKSPKCQRLREKLGYKSVLELEGYFFRRLQAFLRTKHKKILGWEEIAEGDHVDHDAIIYSWKGLKAGIKNARLGYQVIMMPVQHCYLDMVYNQDPHEPGYYWGGPVNLQQVYQYNPLPLELATRESDNILGIQAALWTETITNREQLDYMLFPRLAALAEVAWTQESSKSWRHFVAKLPALLNQLTAMGLNYRPPWRS